jgi:transcription-repair coupling factor (superfamily II helicase)
MRISNILEEYQEYQQLRDAVASGKTPASVAGVTESAHAHLIDSLSRNTQSHTLVMTYSDMEAKNLCRDLRFFTDRVLYFPSKEYVFYPIESSGRENEHIRLETLYHLCFDEERYIVAASLDAVEGYTVDKDRYLDCCIEIELGRRFDIQSLQQKLVHMGYSREEMVEGKGQFCVRGGILDIFCPYLENPVRIEFFDDETDSIREFDASTQRSMDKLDTMIIAPCVEAVFDDERRLAVIEKLEQTKQKLQRKKSDQQTAIEMLEADIEKLQEQRIFPAIDKYASLIYDTIPTVLEYFDEQSVVCLMETKRIAERAKTLEWEQGEVLDELSEKGMLCVEGLRFWKSYEEIKEKVLSLRAVAIEVLSHTNAGYPYKTLVNFTTKTTVSFHGKVDYLYDDLKEWKKIDTTVVILAGNRGRGENLAGTLNAKGFACRYLNERAEFEPGETIVMRGALSKGFEYPDVHFVLVSDKEIFAEERRRSKRKVEHTNKIKSFQEISVGDYVVHQSHGIGQYVGIHKIEVGGVIKDYLKIQYKGTDSLYVPVDQLNLLYKYIGNTDAKIKLNKLGGSEWNKTKARVKKSTADMAKQLIALYAEREQMRGFAFSNDTPWQREFEDTFAYQETDDQMRSIEEVKKDMEDIHPMDRLLCGDVGYGKTEVAIRAAFKAAMDSKQVAYLCPTTVLAMQQYNNFCDRMEKFPVKVEMLSRFRTPQQQKQILKQLKTGEIDILIGTHRILQKDLQFKDLGLLIVDEEQRFGVAHKEKLKELKKNVDVLTMTATPIPRTLHMAMVNIRDMSILSEPPENRYPVQTYVLEYNAQVVLDAMKKELARGGQVFYLFNRVQGIYRVAEWIKQMLPDANVAVGHGKMNENELEDIMYDMVNGNTDILVCTTIIETGLDIPNANTMIIEHADRMGLSQLYQLRGRVGRSNRSAYAYLTYRKDSILSDVAQKRLRAIKEFTEFGSGFKIALRDLEIRGAGNILGAQQHGHMDAVGYDMYCKLLKESVDEMQGVIPVGENQVVIDMDVDAYIPEKYIGSNNQRIEIYKKIAAIESEDDCFEMEDELVDRFGDIPRAASNLISIAQIKYMARDAGIYEVEQKGDNVLLKFNPGQADMKMVADLIGQYKAQILFSAAEKPYLTYRSKREQKRALLENIKQVLTKILELKGEKQEM